VRKLILLFLLPLAGCWEGDSFYTASDSRPALPPGTYRVVPDDHSAKPETVKVSMLPDGMTAMGDKDSSNAVGFAPLNGSYFVMWMIQDRDRPHEALYALFQSERGHYRLLAPFCDRTKAIAAAAGAEVKTDPKLTTCRFQTRAQLEDAFRHLEGQKVDSVDFIPIRRSSRPSPAL
jgi:hypothetical protein